MDIDMKAINDVLMLIVIGFALVVFFFGWKF